MVIYTVLIVLYQISERHWPSYDGDFKIFWKILTAKTVCLTNRCYYLNAFHFNGFKFSWNNCILFFMMKCNLENKSFPIHLPPFEIWPRLNYGEQSFLCGWTCITKYNRWNVKTFYENSNKIEMMLLKMA